MTTIQVVREAVLDELIDRLEDEAWDIPCKTNYWLECDRRAEWILHRLKCCTRVQPIIFACTEHKDRMLAKKPPYYCTQCGSPFQSLSHAFPLIEPVNGRPA